MKTQIFTSKHPPGDGYSKTGTRYLNIKCPSEDLTDGNLIWKCETSIWDIPYLNSKCPSDNLTDEYLLFEY